MSEVRAEAVDGEEAEGLTEGGKAELTVSQQCQERTPFMNHPMIQFFSNRLTHLKP